MSQKNTTQITVSGHHQNSANGVDYLWSAGVDFQLLVIGCTWKKKIVIRSELGNEKKCWVNNIVQHIEIYILVKDFIKYY